MGTTLFVIFSVVALEEEEVVTVSLSMLEIVLVSVAAASSMMSRV
jgi:hypothetical protein